MRIYNCGPTVYKRQHVGNMRRFLFADILRRTLELIGYEVRDITNITDVGHLTQDDLGIGDDKLEVAAKERNVTPQDIAKKETAQFMADLEALCIQPAHLYPRASEHIPQMQALITKLIEKGHAYVASSGVYFSVESFPAYGSLSGNTLDALDEGHRVEVREEKKHPADFALWVIDSTHLVTWPSPWGQGYPGWHIECSAMALEYLGSDIDIHTGGEDNIFPHHENEIAQAEGATGTAFVRTWMHNRHLQLNGQKLSKREGEQVTLDTLKEKGYSPLAFRLLVLSAHYRTLMDFSWEAMDQATVNLETLSSLVRRVHEFSPASSGTADAGVVSDFVSALADDLNTPKAMAVVYEYIKDANGSLSADTASGILATLHQLDKVLGVIGPIESELEKDVVPKAIMELVEARETAKKNKEYEKADELRGDVQVKGYIIEDTPHGPRVKKG